MVRFRYKRPAGSSKLNYFPYYIEPWTEYDPNDTSNCTFDNTWSKFWEYDDDRDRLHKKNSYYYSLEMEDGEDDFPQDSPTLAILLFGTIIFCLFVPQIVDLFISAFCPRPPRPPSPPTPPPTRRSRKRFRLYHYAKPTNKKAGRKSLVGHDVFLYDPENILNYVSDTRIKALQAYSDEDSDEEKTEQEILFGHQDKP